MNGKSGLRGWHAWWSVVLALPIVIVSLTAVFIAHGKSLGLGEIAASAGWLPGYSVATMEPAVELRAVYADRDGTRYVAAKQGLFVSDGETLQPVEALAGMEVRGLVRAGGTLYAAAKDGVWANRGDGWARILKAEAWSLNAQADGALVAAVKDRGVLVSRDGGDTWSVDAALREVVTAYAATAPAKPLTLANLVMDLHTGKAFLGKEYEWLWIDVVGLTMVFLSFSGLIVWWRTRRQKLKATLAMLAPAEAQPGPAAPQA
jgi:hypothetical protein